MLQRINAIALVLLASVVAVAALHGAPPIGKLSGVVVDPAGTPQMGATVWVAPEGARAFSPIQLLTNEGGLFVAAQLAPGLYSARVTLAGFLPTIERHIRVERNLTTLVRIELDSVFSSLDRLRRGPNPSTDTDEWTWVLRTSAATRPVLRWVNGEVVLDGEASQAEAKKKHAPRGRVELTAGARHPGSVSNLADSPATAFAYEQSIGHVSRLMLAGQASYERSAAAGFATMWLPAGEPGKGPEASLVLRQSKLGSFGPTFRGVRMEHKNQLALGDRFTLRYGAEYVLVGLGDTTSLLRPRGELSVRLAPTWRASLILASHSSADEQPTSTLQAALETLDAFPAVMFRNGRPVLENDWHEEFSVEHPLGPNSTLTAAVFRERSTHTPVFGRGPADSPDFFQDFFSNAFVYDGGRSNSAGTRVAYRQKFSCDVEAVVVYAWAGALVADPLASSAENLRDALQVRNFHSLAARVSTSVPRLGTHVTASYKWIPGVPASRQDPYGENAYGMDPNLNLSLRQPLPSFLGKFEALAEFRNLLAQGYVPVTTREGHVVLVPSFRAFRGGVSFQF